MSPSSSRDTPSRSRTPVEAAAQPYVPASAVLLAGGKSSRMGTNKALLRFADGSTVIERMITTLRALCPEILLITNEPDTYAFLGLPMHKDIYPGASSLGGIFTGLSCSSLPRSFVVSCDLPLLDARVVQSLLNLPFNYDLLIPFIAGRQQPLHAIYAKSCLEAMRLQIAAGDLKIVRLLESLRGVKVDETFLDAIDPQRLSFKNMNTPRDWAEVQRLVEEPGPV